MALFREKAAALRREEELRLEAKAQRKALEQRCAQDLVETSWSARVERYKGAGIKYSGPCAWGHCSPFQLIQRAAKLGPVMPGHAVTEFCDWVFDLEHANERGSDASLKIGKLLEQKLLERDRSRREIAFVRGNYAIRTGFRVLYEDNLSPSSRTFTVSSMRLYGRPLIAKPDLVLEDETGCVYIVDRKASNIDPPTFGWHNVRAQLWAYSQIDEWRARRMRLCVEVWTHDADANPLGCQVLSWAKRDVAAEQGLRRLFEIYGGKCAD